MIQKKRVDGKGITRTLVKILTKDNKSQRERIGFSYRILFLCFFSNQRVRDGEAEQEQLLGLGLKEVGFDWATWRTVNA